MHAAEEEDGHHQRGETGHGIVVDQVLEQDEEPVGKGQQRDDGTADGGDAQRCHGEGGDALDGQVEQLEEAPLALARHAVLLVEEQLMLAEADPAEHALRVALRLAQAAQGTDADGVQEAEVARVGLQGDARGVAEQGVEGGREPSAEEGLAAAGTAAGIDVVVALLPEAEHVGDQLGRMLQVGVHDHHAVAGDIVETGQHGSLFAIIA